MVITGITPTLGWNEAQGKLSLETQTFPSERFFTTIKKKNYKY